MIDFQRIKDAALSHAEGLLCELFPAGRRDGHEFRVGGLAGDAGRSLSINMRTGKWADFASGDTGSDLIALWAAARSLKMSEAARELDDRLNAGGITAQAPKADGRSSKTEASEWEALPFGPEQSAPSIKRLFREDEWKEFPVAASWEYRDAEGRLVGYVCRVNFPDGSKDVFPFTFARGKSGREEWRWKGFARPRPLYRLPDLIANPSAGVLIVEGEKTADAAARLLPGVVVVTWPGGSKALPLVDVEPLRGRRCTLWPDADKPGLDAMAKLADRIHDIAASTLIALPPDGVADGWDLADAEREGWTTDRVRDHVRARKESAATAHEAAEAPLSEPESPPPDDDPREPTDDDGPPATQHDGTEPFRYLGFGDGKYFYLPSGSRQIVDLTASEHKKLPLMQLANLHWWIKMFGDAKGNPDWDMAANALIQRSTREGIFNPKRIRGRGAWIDHKRVVFHAGDRLIVDNVTTGIHEFDTAFIYEQGYPLEPYAGAQLSNADAAKVIGVFKSLPWKHALSANLIAGWCALAPICGVLEWRPHIWVSGARGTGKTTVVNKCVMPLLGRIAIEVVSSSTEAGIRQQLKSDALPIVFDEAESESKHGQARMQSILEFARPCSSESGAEVAKGTASGTAMRFKPRSMFCFASIGVAAVQAADVSRVAILELKKRTTGAQEAYDKTLALIAESLAQEGFCESVRARSLSLAPIIRDNAKTFARVLGRRLSDARLGDQIGALLAGAFSLTSRNKIDEADADAWVEAQDWSFFEPDEADSDQHRAFTMLADAHIRVESDKGPALTRTVGELVDEAMSENTSRQDARAILQRHGLRILDGEGAVAVANGHQFLSRVFSDSAWSGKHKDQLARVPGARPSTGPVSFGSGSKHRAVLVPLSLFAE